MKKNLRLIKRNVKRLVVNIGQIYFRFARNKVECNICHYKANHLDSGAWHKYCQCPKCNLGVRQRLLWAALTLIEEVKMEKIIKDKDILHFAPELFLRNLLKKQAGKYRTADLAPERPPVNIDFDIDISNMDQIKNEEYDVVIAGDVLQHVFNHMKAITEVHRILRKNGYCIFTIPQKDHLEKTYEDLSITDPKEREKNFGRWDHLRIYGDDFAEMLKNVGFDVIAVDETFFDKNIVDKHVLFPPVLSKHLFATNYRKVYFGRKQ